MSCIHVELAEGSMGGGTTSVSLHYHVIGSVLAFLTLGGWASVLGHLGDFSSSGCPAVVYFFDPKLINDPKMIPDLEVLLT